MPSSVMRISRLSPSVGVPVRFVVIDVIAAFCPVIDAILVTSVLIAGVADRGTTVT